MNLRALITKYLGWCPMNPVDESSGFSIKRQTTLEKKDEVESPSNLYQICPVCKKLVPESDLICPYCNTSLSSDYIKCPYCKKPISQKDTVCPHCNKLLIYEYPKQIAAKRNKVLFPLAFILLSSIALVVYLQWRGIQLNWFIGIVFMAFWLIGFVLYGAYMGKGDKDFWW